MVGSRQRRVAANLSVEIPPTQKVALTHDKLSPSPNDTAAARTLHASNAHTNGTTGAGGVTANHKSGGGGGGGGDSDPFVYDINDMSHLFEVNKIENYGFGLLAEMGGVAGLAHAFRTDLKTGLHVPTADTTTDPGLTHRRQIFGWNRVEAPPITPFWEHVWNGLHDPMLIVLMIAGVVSIIFGMIQDPGHGWVEGFAIMMAVFIVVSVTAFNNYSQEKEFRALDSSKAPPTTTVIRNGSKVISPDQPDGSNTHTQLER